MSRYVLKRDVELTLWGRTFTVPKGATCRLAKKASGDCYVVADTSLLIRLTGDSRNPLRQDAVVNQDDVFEIPFVERKRTPARKYRI